MTKHITFCVWVAVGLFLIVFQALADEPDSLWSHTYGTDTTEACYSHQQTSDGGFILGGYTKSLGAGMNDFWLVKTDANGDSLWSNTFGGSDHDVCYSVQQTSDGGYIMAGNTKSYGAGDNDFWLVKTDVSGTEEWSNTFGGSGDDRCHSVQQTFDGGYILAGNNGSGAHWSFWLVKTDASGTEEWSNTFGGTYSDQCYSVRQTSDSGYIMAGSTDNFGSPGFDMWVVKTDSVGAQQWAQIYGGYANEDAQDVRQTSDGGYIMAGCTGSYGAGDKDFYLVKTNASGIEQWYRTFGGSAEDRCYSVQQTSDGGYILSGITESFGAGDTDFYLVKTDSNGYQEWDDTFGGSAADYSRSVVETPERNFVLAGYTSSFGAGYQDFWLVKTAYTIPPRITSITDVGNDQGRQVRIRWDRCIYDGYWPDYVIENYNIYRRIDQYLLADDGKNGRSGLDWPPGEWDYVTTVPAEGEETYATIVPTLADSTSEGIYWSVYFVRAKTPDPLVHFSSEVDSGYSVDNLAPDETVMTAMVQASPNTVKLQWQEVTTGGGGQLEQGGVWYRVYGSTDPMFTPAPENLLTTTQNLEFEHNIGTNDKYFYIIRASDDH